MGPISRRGLYIGTGLIFLLAGIVLIVNGSAGALIFGIPLVIVGLLCLVLSIRLRGDRSGPPR